MATKIKTERTKFIDPTEEVLEFDTLYETNRGTKIHAVVIYPKDNPENYIDEIAGTLGYLHVFDGL